MKVLILLFAVLNLYTFILFGYDKYLARANKRRIQEKKLFVLALMGGSLGAVFGQKIFRHKSTKYRNLFWIILIVQFVLYESLWFYSQRSIFFQQ